MAFVERDYEDRFGSMGEYARPRDGQICWISAGAPARNQIAMTASKIMHPQEEVGMNGQIGLPKKWCARSHGKCISHAIPMNRYDRRPA